MNKVLLVGLPNAGKTTLLNALTGSAERVGNRHGVTTEAVCKKYKNKALMCDLPGLYSLKTASNEEKAALTEISAGADLIINVIEAGSILHALSLTRELIADGHRVAVIITKHKQLERRGGRVDAKILSLALGVPCINYRGRRSASLWVDNLLASGVMPSMGVDEESIGKALTLPDNDSLTALDRLTFRPVFAAVAYLLIMLAVLYVCFGRYGLGVFCGTYLAAGLDFLQKGAFALLLNIGLSRGAAGFLCDGFLGGVFAVAEFIPQLALVYFFTLALEDSGLMPRVAVALDKPLKRLGLSGKALFALSVGVGCTAIGTQASACTECDEVRRRTVLGMMFLPCSARLPIISAIAGQYFSGGEFLIVAFVYALGVGLLAVVTGANYRASGGYPYPVVIELPGLKPPSPLSMLKQLNNYLKKFIIKLTVAGTVISSAIWLLSSLDFTLHTAVDYSSSMLGRVGSWLAFLFEPMGISSYALPVAVVCGLFLKEGFLSALAVAAGGVMGVIPSSASALACIIFVAFYTPCTVCLYSVKHRLNGSLCAFYGVFTFLTALLGAYLCFGLCHLLNSCTACCAVMLAAVYAVGTVIYILNGKEEFYGTFKRGKIKKKSRQGEGACPCAKASCGKIYAACNKAGNRCGEKG